MSTKIPCLHSASLNGPAYCENCRIRNNHEQLSFKYHKYSTGIYLHDQIHGSRTLPHHSLVFQLEGEIHITWGEYKDVVIKAGEMYFLPRGAEVSGYIMGDVSFVVARIARGMTTKELDDLRAMKDHEKFAHYEFKPMVMHPPMLQLAKSVRDYLASGVNCYHMHEAKFSELYVILHWYYSIADNAQLFYPMSGALSEFRNFILDNYSSDSKIDDLVSKSNMSRSTFNRKCQRDIQCHTSQMDG